MKLHIYETNSGIPNPCSNKNERNIFDRVLQSPLNCQHVLDSDQIKQSPLIYNFLSFGASTIIL